MNLKHDKAIKQFFEMFFEDWMDETERQEFVVLALQLMGRTLEDLDADIEQGLQNGYSVEEQFDIIRQIIADDK